MEQKNEIQLLIVLFSLSFFVILVFIIGLIHYLQKKKAHFTLEKERSRIQFEEQILRTEIEITEQNLKNLSWELHDNIGQLLSVASLELKIIIQSLEVPSENLNDVSDLLAKSIYQIRSMSKSLNRDVIQSVGLLIAIKNELERLERLDLIKTKLTCPEEININKKLGLIVFRMIQEFISNTLKHSQATFLLVSIDQFDNKLHFVLSDNGCGFDLNSVEYSNGIINLRNRAKLINASFNFDSKIGSGTRMAFTINTKIDYGKA